MPASGNKAEAATGSKASALSSPAVPAAKVDAAPSADGKKDKKSIIKVKLALGVKPKGKAPVPDGLAKKYYIKSTFNTSDIMHSPVEKTIRMLDKILAGEKLFTM